MKNNTKIYNRFNVLDCCTEFSVILRIPFFEDCRDA